MKNASSRTIAIVGLGYVGLPLALEFAKTRRVVGFDIDQLRVHELKQGVDRTLETSSDELKSTNNLHYSHELKDLTSCDFFIITVPTPVDSAHQPDMRALKSASNNIGRLLKAGDIVVYESTVYPGATEEVCVPILEEASGLTFNVDFFVGYSPERINPGDKTHRVSTIKKVTSGSTPETALIVDEVYKEIVVAGTYLAESIKIAEAAKVIENTQRDVNIALMNELALIFNRMGIDTESVLNAAGTKWNFLPFRPGLVGGHCIGVDPYYLTHKAQSVGFHPEIILAVRRLNDSMGAYVATQLVKAMLKAKIQVFGSRVLIMGITFKENCPDIRNTRIIDIIAELKDHGVAVDVVDPWADPDDVRHELGIELTSSPNLQEYDGVILAVAHDQFKEMAARDIRAYGKSPHILYDLKYVLAPSESDLRL